MSNKDKEIESKQARVAELVDRSDASWRTGQIEVFNWALVQIRKAWAVADLETTREAIKELGVRIKEERDRRFPALKEEAANEQAPPESPGS